MAIASVSVTGCSSLPTINRPMHTYSLDHFMVDCSQRDQQVQFLLSQLSSRDDRLLSWVTNVLDPFGLFRQDSDYGIRTDIASGTTNWQIRQNLLHIKHYCG